MRVIPCLMLLLLASASAVQPQVRNAELGYSLILPEGFTDFPAARSQKDIVESWSEATAVSAGGPLVLLVARMHGTLSREAMRQEDVPANTQVVSFKWKRFDVSGLKTLTTQAGQPVFVLVAQVPLRKEAVQLSVAGPADQAARGHAIMEATLASLEGETNWLTSAERSGRLGRPPVCGSALRWRRSPSWRGASGAPGPRDARGTTMTERKTLAILVGGGPAPGINSVIGAATIRARLEAVDVLGIRDGFKWIMQGDIDHVTPLDIGEVSRIHFRGGSHIGISRANPTKDPMHLDNAVLALLRLNVSQLITIGGDDTAYSAMKLEEKAAGRLQVVHVPKTIDNDLDLPPHVDTFGFQTARHYGVEIVKNLMVDARTTSRWYLVITMGRGAGHLAVGIGKAAGATLTLIPEE